jgi:hypothetical protein
MIATRRGADVGDVKAGNRQRAVGTRDRVVSYLLAVGEIADAGGMASNVLADAIGYPGSSIAFAQLLSGMERAGLIEREIRGKRTYRILPAEGAAAQLGAGTLPAAPGRTRRPVAARAVPEQVAAGRAGRTAARARRDAGGRGLVVPAKGAEDFDYDELARRLLVQVVQLLAAAPGQGLPLPAAGAAGLGRTASAGAAPAGAGPGPAGPGAAGAGPGPAGPKEASLARTVASLEHKLASVRSRQRKLSEENARLCEQLRAVQESLAQAEEQAGAGRGSGQLDSTEVSLLERLLSPLREKGDQREGAGTG